MAEGARLGLEGRISAGLTIPRVFTKAGINPFDEVEWDRRSSSIKNPDGSTVFEMHDIEVPKTWSQVATDILAQKYFRKAGVPLADAEGKPIVDSFGRPVTGSETSAKQVIHRIAGCWKHWGEKFGYFNTPEDAQAFYDELVFMLVRQYAAPNSPQWFNTGLNWAYGTTGPAQGHWYVDPQTRQLTRASDAYSHPQVHACFIQSIKDELVNEGGIMDLWVREARIFKYGSGTGTNFSTLRGKGEALSGGGRSSGVMSFLKIGDATGGAIKSGGTTRRAAKMVILNVDHPEIEEFIDWKYKEEQKARVLIQFGGLPADYEGEAYQTVSGQNSNNSVRVSNAYMRALEANGDWNLTWRTDGRVCKTMKAQYLWDKIAQAAWSCADPGLQFDDTINDWHTCPASGRINGSNPCSEYMFLDETACNLASINLIKFFDDKTRTFDVEKFRHAARLWTIVLEISVLMAGYPSSEIARKSYEFRTLGLGYTNLGAMLMRMGIPYDSEEAFAISAALSALMTGESYSTSAEMSSVLGPFQEYDKNKDHMLRVIRNHRRAAYSAAADEYEKVDVKPIGISHKHCPDYLLQAVIESWDRALDMGQKFGYRNAQTTLIAPTGTISLLMDCDTTGMEPDFALVKFKKLAGGGYFKIINQSVVPALRNLNYGDDEIREIVRYIMGSNTLKDAPGINTVNLKSKGFKDEEIQKIEKALPGVFDINQAFNVFTLGKDCMKRLGISEEKYSAPGFSMLKELGFSAMDIEVANEYICGSMTIEGAPFVKSEHYAVFDCANKCGRRGQRYIQFMAHVRMMAALQPFLSGSISKTVNMTNEATLEQVKQVYMESWKLGLKSISLYRDGSKASQPLSTKTAEKTEREKFVPMRRRLPAERTAITHKFRVGNQEGFITVGLFEDGSPGEIFVSMSKQGSTLAGFMHSFAIMTSVALQYGVPLRTLVDKFAHMRFEPSGWTDNPQIQVAKSVVDYIFRWMSLKFLPKEDQQSIGINGMEAPKEDSNGEGFAAVPSINEFIKESVEEKALDGMQKSFDAGAKNPTKPNGAKFDLYGDAPMCSSCGSMMMRSGTCYVCTGCGTTTGCA
jgi:ribonucleoside-diphosphate reductase alpha chain